LIFCSLLQFAKPKIIFCLATICKAKNTPLHCDFKIYTYIA
jgi:hypothetical protein